MAGKAARGEQRGPTGRGGGGLGGFFRPLPPSVLSSYNVDRNARISFGRNRR